MSYHMRIRRSTKLPDGSRFIENESVGFYVIRKIFGGIIKIIFFPLILVWKVVTLPFKLMGLIFKRKR